MAAKKTVKPRIKKEPAKKTLSKKVPEKTRSKRRPRGFKPSTITKSDFDKMVMFTADEVEDYLLLRYQEDDDDIYDLPSITEMGFCHAYLSNGFKQGPAIRTVLPDLATANSVQRAHDFLARERVQRYLSRELHNRRLRMGVTAEWICKKYLAWATLDITDFLEFKEAVDDGRQRTAAAVYLKGSLKDLPPLVRQSIKSITVDDKGKVKIEFIDQKSALDSLAKMLGYANDKLTLDAKTPIHLHFDSQDNEA